MFTNSAKRQRRGPRSIQTDQRLYTGRTAQLDVVNRLMSPANFARNCGGLQISGMDTRVLYNVWS
jgi:hypothetical protein